jgi:hypothetical protein
MPVKRRNSKRRIGTEAEAAAWRGVFETGYDFFNELSDVGITFTTRTELDHVETSPDFLPAARAAWKRFGADFMTNWQPESSGRRSPWAIDEFGPP